MWEDGLAVPEGECSIDPTYSVENTTCLKYKVKIKNEKSKNTSHKN